MMPHAFLIPLPFQGHINPMMQLASNLAEDGFLITFLNTDFNHNRIIKANARHKLPLHHNITLISIPDGLPADRRNDVRQVLETLQVSMGPSVIHKLIQQNNDNEPQHRVSCIIADVWTCFGLQQVAKHFHIPLAALHTSLVSTCTIRYFSSRLVSLGLLSPQGNAKIDQKVEYLPSMPALYPDELPWQYGGEYIFQMGIRTGKEISQIKWVLYNSIYDLEAPVADELSKEVGTYPIGPLIPPEFLEEGRAINTTKAIPSLWAEEDECLEWLNKQCFQSVIYVSFGSLAVWSERQVEEFGAGLEATQRPFLWVLRPDLAEGRNALLPPPFSERIKDRGCIVGWAPQLKVLSHPSIACFVTHCEWNSVQESITMGVPMLCSPRFAEQSLNKAYIVDVWKVGLPLNKNKDGIVEKGEFIRGVERLLVEEEGSEIRKEVSRLKSIARNAVKEGGSSFSNYSSFVLDMKKQC